MSAAEKLTNYEDKGFFRRKYPRKKFNRKIGVLCSGVYFIADAQEVGEGGLAFHADFVLKMDDIVLLNLQIPHGDFASERAQVKTISEPDSSGFIHYGVSFLSIGFSRKRQIRAFVSNKN